MPHRHPVKVRFYELDPYGHLNHSAYIQLFETGRIELLEEAGIPLQNLEKHGFRFLVSRIETSFFKPVEAGAELIVETQVIEIKKVSTIWYQKILRGETAAATQKIRLGITDLQGKPTRLPQVFASKLESYQSKSPLK
tara:strand:+ start:349 stop:762 length:414 start_codon:yes stop_codon:yes gene_type:complete